MFECSWQGWVLLSDQLQTCEVKPSDHTDTDSGFENLNSSARTAWESSLKFPGVNETSDSDKDSVLWGNDERNSMFHR